jgi:hypothetical protein
MARTLFRRSVSKNGVRNDERGGLAEEPEGDTFPNRKPAVGKGESSGLAPPVEAAPASVSAGTVEVTTFDPASWALRSARC